MEEQKSLAQQRVEENYRTHLANQLLSNQAQKHLAEYEMHLANKLFYEWEREMYPLGDYPLSDTHRMVFVHGFLTALKRIRSNNV